jgi:hypothetical protein
MSDRKKLDPLRHCIGKRVVRVDSAAGAIWFEDGSFIGASYNEDSLEGMTWAGLTYTGPRYGKRKARNHRCPACDFALRDGAVQNGSGPYDPALRCANVDCQYYGLTAAGVRKAMRAARSREEAPGVGNA